MRSWLNLLSACLWLFYVVLCEFLGFFVIAKKYIFIIYKWDRYLMHKVWYFSRVVWFFNFCIFFFIAYHLIRGIIFCLCFIWWLRVLDGGRSVVFFNFGFWNSWSTHWISLPLKMRWQFFQKEGYISRYHFSL